MTTESSGVGSPIRDARDQSTRRPRDHLLVQVEHERHLSNCEDLKVKEMPEADAVIVFSCAGRLMALGPMIQQEIGGIDAVWNVPMAGMFSNAELARATGGNLEMHNCTTCVVALKEK